MFELRLAPVAGVTRTLVLDALNMKIQEAIGRLKERYPRVARYYAITYDAATRTVRGTEQTEKKTAVGGHSPRRGDRARMRAACGIAG
jgi:hypothetical protein